MRNKSYFSRPQSIGEILDRSFRLYRNHLGALLMTAAILLVPVGILNTIFNGVIYLGQTGGGFGDMVDITASSSGIGAMSIVLSIVIGIVTTITTLALTYQVARLLKGKEPTTGESLSEGRGHFWRYFWLTLLQAGAMAGLLLGAGLIFLILRFLGGDSVIVIGIMALLGIALFCAFVFVVARWSVALPALVEQGLTPSRSMTYSWELTDGYIWRCILFGFLLVILSLITLILPASLLFLASLVFEQTPAIVMIIIDSIEVFFNIMWLPLQMAAYVMFYFDLRVRKEGYDLSQRLDQLESEARLIAPGSIY